MGMLDEPDPMFSPKPQYVAHYNFKALNRDGTDLTYGVENYYEKEEEIGTDKN